MMYFSTSYDHLFVLSYSLTNGILLQLPMEDDVNLKVEELEKFLAGITNCKEDSPRWHRCNLHTAKSHCSETVQNLDDVEYG